MAAFRAVALSISLLLSFVPHRAIAATDSVKVIPAAGVNFTTAADNFHTDYSAGAAFLGGVLLNAPITSWLSGEIGGLYVQRRWIAPQGVQASTTYTTGMLQFPMMLRLWPASVFAVGLGGYFGTYLGQVKSEITSPTGQIVTTTQTYAEALRKTFDLGALASVAFFLPSGGNDIVWDTRLVYDLVNNKSDTNTLRFYEIQVLIGYAIPLK